MLHQTLICNKTNNRNTGYRLHRMMLSGITGSSRGLTQFPVSKQAGGCLIKKYFSNDYLNLPVLLLTTPFCCRWMLLWHFSVYPCRCVNTPWQQEIKKTEMMSKRWQKLTTSSTWSVKIVWTREEEAGRLLSSFFPFLSAKFTSWFNSQELHHVKVLMEQGGPTPAPEESSSPNNFEWQRAQEVSHEF